MTGRKAFRFPPEPRTVLDPVIDSGRMIFARKQDYFPTPPEIIETMMCWAEIKSGMSVLEPSCGEGAIVSELADYFGKLISLDMCEINPKLVSTLYGKNFADLGYTINCCNFLDHDPKKLYDRIIMNPPFAQFADIDHGLKAFSMLRRGGILVTLMAHGVLWRKEEKAANFRRFIEPYEHMTIEYTANEFKASGTNAKTCLIALIK